MQGTAHRAEAGGDDGIRIGPHRCGDPCRQRRRGQLVVGQQDQGGVQHPDQRRAGPARCIARRPASPPPARRAQRPRQAQHRRRAQRRQRARRLRQPGPRQPVSRQPEAAHRSCQRSALVRPRRPAGPDATERVRRGPPAITCSRSRWQPELVSRRAAPARSPASRSAAGCPAAAAAWAAAPCGKPTPCASRLVRPPASRRPSAGQRQCPSASAPEPAPAPGSRPRLG